MFIHELTYESVDLVNSDLGTSICNVKILGCWKVEVCMEGTLQLGVQIPGL